MDDPVLVEAEEDDFWFRGFNMRTGERGVFPAFYAHAVPGPAKDLLGKIPLQEEACHHPPSPLAPPDLGPCDFSSNLYPYPREQTKPLLGGALRCAVLGLRGGTMSPGQRHPVCSHAEGQCGGGGGHRLEAHLGATLTGRHSFCGSRASSLEERRYRAGWLSGLTEKPNQKDLGQREAVVPFTSGAIGLFSKVFTSLLTLPPLSHQPSV